MDSPTVLIVLHWDMFPECLPLSEISEFSKRNNMILISAPNNNQSIFPSEDAIPITGYYRTWEDDICETLKGERVLLCGGYRSLCIREAYDILAQHELHVSVNPDWIVEDPLWYTPDSALRAADGLSFIWEYPVEGIVNTKQIKAGCI